MEIENGITRRGFAGALAVGALGAIAGGALTGCSSKSSDSSSKAGVRKISSDTVVIGTVYTSNPDQPFAEAIAVKDGEFVFVGSKDGVKSYINKHETEVIETDGVILAGATEGHGHSLMKAITANLDTCEAESLEEIVDAFQQLYDDDDERDAYYMFGWNSDEIADDLEEAKMATKLDKICEDKPVLLVDYTGAYGFANTCALQEAGIYEDGEVAGGTIEQNSKGVATGLLCDQAVNYVRKKVFTFSFTESEMETILDDMQWSLYERGYTNCFEAWYNYYQDDWFEAAKKYDEKESLLINLEAAYEIASYENKQTEVEKAKKIKDSYTSTHFNPDALKIFVDGSVEECTGWMLTPYPSTEEHGDTIWTEKEIESLIKSANPQGLKVHGHTCGDGACNAMITAIANCADGGTQMTRNTLAHVRNIQTSDVEKAKNYDIAIAEAIAYHVAESDELEEGIPEAIGEETYYAGYPIKSLLDNGIKLSSSGDSPTVWEDGDYTIWEIIEAAVTGQTYENDFTEAPFAPRECVSVEQAVDCLTINGAWQLGIDEKCGSIEVGKSADFIVADQDIFSCSVYDIHNTNTTLVYFEGEEVYNIEDDEETEEDTAAEE